MKVCIYGAGAIGGHVAARLVAKTSAEVSIIARGAHLAAIRENGIKLRVGGEEIGGRVHAATDDPADLPVQDVVLVTLKGPSLPAEASRLSRLLGDKGVAVFLMNGIPWWWNHGTGRDELLELLDPGGALSREVGPQRALHGVVSSSNAVVAPGVIQNGGGNRWLIGEPDGSKSARVQAIVDLFVSAGLNGVVSSDIRADIWRKLFVNISSNPFAALTRLTSRQAPEIPGLDDIAVRAIEEALAVAAAKGRDLRGEVNPDAIEGIVGQVVAFAREAGVKTPTLDVVLPLLRGLDHAMKLAREGKS
jgi:2-dehydropantoate 2-reductase